MGTESNMRNKMFWIISSCCCDPGRHRAGPSHFQGGGGGDGGGGWRWCWWGWGCLPEAEVLLLTRSNVEDCKKWRMLAQACSEKIQVDSCHSRVYTGLTCKGVSIILCTSIWTEVLKYLFHNKQNYNLCPAYIGHKSR